jgi:hypothetical protein
VQIDNVLTVASNALVDSHRPLVGDGLAKRPPTDGVFGRSQGSAREGLRSGWEQSILESLWCGRIWNSKNLLAEKGLVREHCEVF